MSRHRESDRMKTNRMLKAAARAAAKRERRAAAVSGSTRPTGQVAEPSNNSPEPAECFLGDDASARGRQSRP
jgi:hypothetical protein